MSSDRALIASDIEEYLGSYQDKELLRFVVVGSVDDGKSTLIGRLLYDTGSVYEDQLTAVRKATQLKGAAIDLSLITDGLAAEREQGITIDVAYRYFSTDKRKFIIADTPGHIQYTRNMATGASTANAAIILIDARLGVLQQSRRHAYIASLLGIAHLAVCVNKIDLVGYDRAVVARIQSEFALFTKNLAFDDVTFFPISALDGTNCVHRSPHTPWYEGPTVLDFLESVPVQDARGLDHLRYPVQYVLRPKLDYRGFAGRVASGMVKKGDAVIVLPSGKSSRVKAIDAVDGERSDAFAPQSVTIRLEDELDVSRGDMLVHPGDVPRVVRTFDAHLIWMHDDPLDTRKTYLLKHTTQTVRADVDRVQWRKDMDTLQEVAATTLALNDIGRVTLTAHRALFLDGYDANRETGSFILIDAIGNGTVAAGLVIESKVSDQDIDAVLRGVAGRGDAHARSLISAEDRRQRFGSVAGVVLLSRAPNGPGVPADALAYAIEQRLFASGATGVVIASRGMASTFSAARAVADAGLLAIVAATLGTVDEVTAGHELEGRRLLVVRATTKASAPREPSVGRGPERAEHAIDVEADSIEQAVDRIVAALRDRGWIG
jgi:bifunctional enzyme CysN/CysC